MGQLLKPVHPGEGKANEKPKHYNWRVTPTCPTWGKVQAARSTHSSQSKWINKIIKDTVIEQKNYSVDKLYDYLKSICYNLQIETPIVLNKHKNQLEEYSLTKFCKEDFVDSIDFDNLVLQYYEK